jgi:Tol biopolymer transport system component
MATSCATVYKFLMRHMAPRTLSVAICLVLLPARVAADSETERLLRVERSKIDKIAALTAQEHSIVLFSIAEYIVGYAKDGQLQWISVTTSSPCPNAFPALSHHGDKVLYQVASKDHKRHLLVYNTTTHSSQQVLEKEGGAFFGTSWSWDDSQITFFDSRGAVIVTIESGDQRVVLPQAEVKQDGYSFEGGIQWLHDGRLILTLDKFIPDTKQRDPRWMSGESVIYIASVNDGHAHVIGVGRWPSVSPVSDEIAAFADNKLVLMTADGSQQRVVSNAPRYPRYLPLFRGILGGHIVWSPNAERLFFMNLVSDNGADNIYLVDLRSGQRKLFLEKTSVTILGWR